MATFEKPDELTLGRVRTDSPTFRAQGSFEQANAGRQSTIDALLNIGNTIATAAVKNQRQKEFYEGQERILSASLEGTQQEELQKVLEEQPYYMQLLGPGAVAEGAVEMSARVGAGKIFNEQSARLAEGLDADVDPDTYRQNIHEMIKAKRTGNPQVDAIFVPQMISKAQSLLGVHLQKHLEHNAKVTQQGVIQETYGAMQGLHEATARELGPGSTFIEGIAPEAMPPAMRAAYKSLVDTFNPEHKPGNISDEQWISHKLMLSEAAIERGDTAVYQAIKESGLFAKLDSKDIARIEKARVQGDKENDSHNQMQFLGKEVSLWEKVLRATDPKDVADVTTSAIQLAKDYDAKGITRPGYLKDDEAIKAFVKSAVGNKEEYLVRMASKNERLAEITANRTAELAEEDQFLTGIINNALADSPSNAVFVTTRDGNSGYVDVKEEDRKKAYFRTKSKLRGMGQEETQAWLKRYNLKSMEDLAYKMQVVDEETKGTVTQLLRLVSGKPLDTKVTPKDTISRIEKSLAWLDHLRSSFPNKDAIDEYITDEGLRKDMHEYFDSLDVTGDVQGSWQATFGRDKSVKVDYNNRELEEALDKSVVREAIEPLGVDSLVGNAWVRAEARRNLELRHAQEPKQAVTQALSKLARITETVGDVKVMGAVPGYKIADRLGLRDNPTAASNFTDIYIKSTLPQGYKYSLDFNPSTGTHVVIPKTSSGEYMWSQAHPLDYSAVKKLLGSSKAVKEATRKAKQQGGFGNASDTQAYPL